MTGKYKNRYDVTILINGLPLVQIELKRNGIELKEAFNQINRYHKHSYRGLFNYVQLFVISNGVNTKYYANNKSQSFKQIFFWSDIENKRYSRLNEFEELLNVEREKPIAAFIDEHKLHEDKVEETMAEYTFSIKIDREREDVKSTFKERLGLRDRRIKIPMITETIKEIIARFTW